MRKQPPGELLKSAHAVDREYRVMSALEKTDVPVPKMIGYCEDKSVIGTLFFVMEYLQGRVFYNPALPELNDEERRSVYRSQLDIAVRLSKLDIEQCGLDSFGSGIDYVARQISIWTRQYRASETETIDAMENLITWLPEHLPDNNYKRTLVHGDFKLDNMIIHPTEPVSYTHLTLPTTSRV